MTALRIGCAGWSVPTARAADFPGEGTHLQRYAARFDCVEINSSFYRPHRRTTYARWAASVPRGFRFAIKFPRQATHEARLVDSDAIIDAFFEQVEGLGDALGPVLVQLPPSLALDTSVASAFFEALRERFDGAIVCEPRHASWFGKDADAIWARHRIARVAADPARLEAAALAGGDAEVAYFRLHGSPRIYYDAYGAERVARWLSVVRAKPAREAWVIFDNTALGHAIDDALTMRALAA